jgi:thiol-disulfide isomerase/thioredoxin
MNMARKKSNSRLFYIIGFVVVVAILGGYIYYQNVANARFEASLGKPIAPSDYSLLLSLSNVYELNYSYVNIFNKLYSKPLYENGKLVVVYIGTEWCPYCAAERWALIIALLRFGNFTGLKYMLSAGSPEPFPNTPTFTFHGSSYSSNYIVFYAYEYQDRNRNSLDSILSQYLQLFQAYGYSIPFISIGNVLIQVGSNVSPSLMSGKNWSQIMQEIKSNTTLGRQIIYSANVLTAAICLLNGNKPSSVCDQPIIKDLEVAIAQRYNIASSM